MLLQLLKSRKSKFFKVHFKKSIHLLVFLAAAALGQQGVLHRILQESSLEKQIVGPKGSLLHFFGGCHGEL